MVTALQSLVRETGDPRVYRFAAENTTDGTGANLSGCAKAMLTNMHKNFLKRAMAGEFINHQEILEAKMERFRRILKDDDPIDNFSKLVPLQPHWHNDLALAWKKEREQHLQNLLKVKSEQDEALREFWDNLLKESDEALARKLTDPLPTMRWAAIHAIAKKRIHREEEMIDLLGDDNPLVRQAAHDALVVLSRGNDFGPPLGANVVQLAASRHRWRQWLKMQDPISPGQAVGMAP